MSQTYAIVEEKHGWLRLSLEQQFEHYRRRAIVTWPSDEGWVGEEATIKDKRDECGCHPDCTWDWLKGVRDHACDKPCEWPACLTDKENDELLAELEGEDI